MATELLFPVCFSGNLSWELFYNMLGTCIFFLYLKSQINLAHPCGTVEEFKWVPPYMGACIHLKIPKDQEDNLLLYS